MAAMAVSGVVEKNRYKTLRHFFRHKLQAVLQALKFLYGFFYNIKSATRRTSC